MYFSGEKTTPTKTPLDFRPLIFRPHKSSKLTWQWKFTFSNRKYIFKWWMFHCYVSLPDGKSSKKKQSSLVLEVNSVWWNQVVKKKSSIGLGWKTQGSVVQENCNTPREQAHPIGNPLATPIMKGIRAYSLLVKVAEGVCSSSVCWNNLRLWHRFFEMLSFNFFHLPQNANGLGKQPHF